jgi:hypothetical protein
MEYTSILKAIQQKGGTANVMDLFGWDATKFDEGFHFANDLQNLNYVKLLHSNYNKNQVVVELTLVGVEFATK